MRCAFACGSGMVEIYADYALMNSINDGKLWGDLAECIKWQKAQEDVLPDVHWVGGNPWDGSKANVYGWAAWNGEKATLALRNPASSQQTFHTTLRQALDIPDYIQTSITLTDAFAQSALSGLTIGTPIDIDTELILTLAASSVYVYNGVDGAPITLYNDQDNTDTLSAANGQQKTVTISGHKLYLDGSWNTLCLPFDIIDFSGTPFEGAIVKTLTNATFNNGTLTLNFSDDLTSIETGKPYIVRWKKAEDSEQTENSEIVNPLFHNVTLINAYNPVIIDNVVSFQGNYSPYTIHEKDKSILYLGSGNILFYPNDTMDIKAFHAYFQLASPISTMGDLNGDGTINMTDVIILVDYILGNTNDYFIIGNADITGDGQINVTDVSALVNIILHDQNYIKKIVVNGADNITFGGIGNSSARAMENHLCDDR
jgi:hypothetical protein